MYHGSGAESAIPVSTFAGEKDCKHRTVSELLGSVIELKLTSTDISASRVDSPDASVQTAFCVLECTATRKTGRRLTINGTCGDRVLDSSLLQRRRNRASLLLRLPLGNLFAVPRCDGCCRKHLLLKVKQVSVV